MFIDKQPNFKIQINTKMTSDEPQHFLCGEEIEIYGQKIWSILGISEF